MKICVKAMAKSSAAFMYFESKLRKISDARLFFFYRAAYKINNN